MSEIPGAGMPQPEDPIDDVAGQVDAVFSPTVQIDAVQGAAEDVAGRLAASDATAMSPRSQNQAAPESARVFADEVMGQELPDTVPSVLDAPSDGDVSPRRAEYRRLRPGAPEGTDKQPPAE